MTYANGYEMEFLSSTRNEVPSSSIKYLTIPRFFSTFAAKVVFPPELNNKLTDFQKQLKGLMKNILLFCLCAISLQLFAQAKGNAPKSAGNVNYEKNKNVNYNNPYTQAKGELPNAVWINDQMVQLEVNVLSNQKASSYVAVFNIKQLGKDAEEADRLLNERYNGFVNAITSLGINRDDIYLDMISFVPVYELEEEKKLFSKKTYNEIPKGFEIQQNVHIRYTDSRILGKLVTAAARNEIYDIVKVDYFVKNTEEIYQEMRKKAVEYVNKEIIQFDVLGVELDAAYRVICEEESNVSPIDRYSSYSAFSSQSLDGSSKGRIKPADKAVTMYYDKISYDAFEIIINPEVVEPVVQYMYNLKVRFRLKQPDPSIKVEREKEFVWLSPDGQLRTLKIDKEDKKEIKPSAGGTTVIPENR